MKLKNLVLIATVGISFPMFAELQFSDVIIRQQWPWSREITVDFAVTGTEGRCHVLNVTCLNDDREICTLSSLDLGGNSVFSTDGYKRLVIDPMNVPKLRSAGFLQNFRIGLSVSDEKPLYMIIDLDKPAGSSGAIRYVTESALEKGSWGAFSRQGDILVWTGANANLYKSSCLVLRRVEASGQSFVMGSPEDEADRDAGNAELQHRVSFSQDFWLGVFEVTQMQWYKLKGNWPSFFSSESCRTMRPVEQVGHLDIRGSSVWDADPTVTASSFCGLLNQRSGGVLSFDLPTEAQWEYACRAGTTGPLNSGEAYTAENIAKLARYNTWGKATSWIDSGTAEVGSYAPNAWGFYDMHGNLCELVLDTYSDYTSADQTDPLMTTSYQLVSRGGSWSYGAKYLRSANRFQFGSAYNTIGFRVACKVR